MAKSATLLWLDLEMTGLDPQKDKIIEVAAIATDWDFNEITTFQSGFGYRGNTVKKLLDSSDFFKKFPKLKDALLTLSQESPPVKTVEKQLVNLVKEYFNDSTPVLLAGNSIHVDREFIKVQLPEFEKTLTYRMVDVSAWKEVFAAKYGKEFKKAETHRALEDIRESIAELKYYLQQLKV